MTPAAARKELERRRLWAEFWSLTWLHLGQLRMLLDLARTVVGCAGRRSGKSFVAVVKALVTALVFSDCAVLYISATRATAKKMAFGPMLALNRKYRLGGLANRTELSLTFPNGSTIYVLGVDSEAAADKCRGIPRVVLAIIDEAQRYKQEVLQYLIRDVLRAAFLDLGERAALWILGTPNPQGTHGEFWERWNRDTNPNAPHNDVPKVSGPGFHTFTCYDNTTLGTREEIDALLDQDLVEEKQTRESAWFRREYLCEWAVELRERVYQLTDENLYDGPPPKLTHYVVAGDIGVRDADALVLLGWTDDDPTLWLARSHVQRGATVTDFGAVIEEWNAAHDPLAIQLDGGGLGLKVIMTLQQSMPGLPLAPVTKPPVNLQVKYLNDRLAAGRLKVPRGSQFATEARRATWVDGVVNGKINEHGHSDLVPAMRYGVIAARPFLPDMLQEAPPDPVKERTRKRRAKMERRYALDGKRPANDQDEAWNVDEAEAW